MAKQVGPNNPAQATLIVAVRPEIRNKLKVIAIREGRSLSAQLRLMLENFIDLYEKKFGSIEKMVWKDPEKYKQSGITFSEKT